MADTTKLKNYGNPSTTTSSSPASRVRSGERSRSTSPFARMADAPGRSRQGAANIYSDNPRRVHTALSGFAGIDNSLRESADDEDDVLVRPRVQRRFNRRLCFYALGIAALVPMLYFFLVYAPTRHSTAYVITPTVKVADYPAELVPQSADDGRLVFVGDIHGCNVEFAELMKEVGFDKKKDKLVLLGDFISKGPDSIAVMELAMELGAKCVRGNHENTLLRRYAKKHNQRFDNDVRDRLADGSKSGGLEHFDDDDDDDDEEVSIDSEVKMMEKRGGIRREVKSGRLAMQHQIIMSQQQDAEDDEVEAGDYDGEEEGFVHVFADEKKIIRKATDAQVEFIDSCPLILRFPEKIFGEDHGEVSATHAGLMWNEPTLEGQDPAVLLYIRTILPPDNSTASPTRDGILWKEVWNDYQETLPASQRRTVLYGHDAKTGLAIKEYSKGLDSRCYKGDFLTALVARVGSDGEWTHDIVSVKCQVHDPKLPGYVDGRW
ncbi:Metallo-dependent phosphatase-like protein [Myxozyma melibiosi]|uniref:Metallo-dependent phosphatase-like protein n=1 Tax=Myxozyma melibiosi TaxID=54550 RepID=A0ABR1FCZ3_9ASCO